jgi:hypothetical protein
MANRANGRDMGRRIAELHLDFDAMRTLHGEMEELYTELF